jgi:hypothetical protein
MIPSLADFQIQTPNPFGEIVEDLGNMETPDGPATPAEILSFVSKMDEAIARTLALLDHILEREATWRTFVFQGKAEYDVEIEKRIEEILKNLADRTETVLFKLDPLRSKGICPESMETLRNRIADVRSMLTPDDDFFEGEELDALANQAIAENDSGATVNFLVMGE